jgi:hypothetical protein
LANLCRWGRRVLFSSSSTDYGEPTHVNVKSPEAWAAEFATHGLLRNFDLDVSFLTPWAVLFEPAVMTVPAVVARYEREYGEARRESLHLRTRLLDSDRMRGELDARVRELEALGRGPSAQELATMQSEVAEVRGDLARERDKTVAARLRAQQLRQQVTDLERQVEEREHSLWELLREIEQLRHARG